MTIKKVLIAAAGYGTRFLPITKSLQKEMLPILNRPTIDYIVADCVKAGITDIVFVVNEHNAQIEDYYTPSPHIANRLKQTGKTEELKALEVLHTQARFTFIQQPQAEQYGTGVPVMLAQEHLENEDAFLVFMGDDFIFSSDHESETKCMISAFMNNDSSALMTCIEKPAEVLHRYGVIEPVQSGDASYLQAIVEKPSPGEAPSNLINISKYILTPEIFPILEKQTVDAKTNELLITDTLMQLVATDKKILLHQPSGEFIDSGNVASWLEANIRIAYADPKLRQQITKTFEELSQSRNT